MVVSIEVAVSLATIFSLLTNLQAPVTCEDTYSVISKLTVPQNINYESLKYPSPVKTRIREAWSHAYLAKKSAQGIASNTYLCAYLSMPAPEGMEGIISLFMEALTQTRTNYYAAIAEASSIYSYELKQAEKDYTEMDNAGFDILNNSFEKLQFEKTKNLLLTGSENLNPSNVYELQSVQETILYNLQRRGTSKGVIFFNQFIGNGKGIDLYEQNHKDAKYLLTSFEKKYKDKLTEAKAKQKQLQEKISRLQEEGALDMGAGFQKQLSSTSMRVSYFSSGTPKSQLAKLKRELKKTSTSKAEFIYSLKKDNYLAEAYLAVSSNIRLLDDSISEANSLNSKLLQVEKTLHTSCLEGLSKTSPSSPVYLEIRQKCNAKGTLAEKIASYSEAIKTARGDYSDYLYLEDFIENSLEQLQKTGVPLSLESNQFENIKNSKATVREKYSSFLSLKKRIAKKAEPARQSFEQKQDELENIVSAVEEKRDVFEISSFELSSDKYELKLMDSKEFCPNAYGLFKEQESLFKKYSSIVSAKAGDYFTSKAETSFYFKELPECNKKQEATEVVNFYNDLVSLEDFHVKAKVFGKEQGMFIPSFEEGSVFSKEFKEKTTPLQCSPQTQEEKGGLLVLKRFVSPAYPLQKAKVKFDLPENAFAVSSSGLFANNSVYLESIDEPIDVFVIFSFQSNSTNSSEGGIFSDSFFLNGSENYPPAPSFNSSSFDESFSNGSSFSSSEKEENGKKIESLSFLLLDYKKAVDDNVQINHQKIQNNYSYYKREFNKLTALSVEEFNKKEPFFELNLKSEINSLKSRAEEEYNKAVLDGANEIFLNRAKQWLDKKYYVRSILYSQFASSLSESQKPQWIFAIAFVLIIFIVYIALRKKEQNYEKKIERKLYSID